MAEQDITQDIWLKRARDAYSGSTTYFDSNVRSQIEANLRQFQGKHPANSKYHSDAYKGRSKLFRPKTRTMVRKNEAIAAAAFFSNEDVVSITAENDADQRHLASAEIISELVQYRLTKTIPWFQIVIGAYQDAMTTGTVISHQYWKYDSKKGIDQPCIDLIPSENFRFDPAADWTDPINSSPYLIWMIPMYYKDVKARMETVDDKTGNPKWKPLTDGEILAASKQSNDSIRQTRQGSNRTDPTDNNTDISEYKIVWVHFNVVEDKGVDFIYYTLGTEHLLSDPIPLQEQYWHGKRPFALGSALIEAHKVYTSAPVELVHDLQVEINEIANQRIDNVKFAMNKRYFAKRNAQVDIRSLTRNVPSSVTLMNDINDVKVLDTPDVTSSSYQEQDRLNLDFDDLAGAFNGSSVQSNRKLNETVGGMTLLSESANEISEYQLRTFVETWAEKVITQLVLLEQKYETDETILIFAGTRAKLYEKYGISEITDEILERNMLVRVNVGVGATNPQAQFERFTMGMTTLANIVGSNVGNRINVEEVTKEIFGKLGYKDGARFFNSADGDPRVAELEQKLQELQAALDAKLDPEIRDATVKKILAEAEFIKAQKTSKNVETQFSAMQTGQIVAANPAVAPVADEVLKGAGWTPIAGDGVQATDVPAGAIGTPAPVVHENTSPLQPPVPASPMTGIETPEADGVQHLNKGGKVQCYADGGVIEPGNIDLNSRPIVHNADGSISTVRSMSFNDGQYEVLIPTVAADGSGILDDDAAIKQYISSGQHLGKFDTPQNADAYAQQLHLQQEQMYANPVQNKADGGAVAGISPTTTADNVPVMATAGEGVLNVEAMALLGEDTLNKLNELGLMLRELQGGTPATGVAGQQQFADGGIIQSIKDGFTELMTGAKARAEEQRQQAQQNITKAVTPKPINRLNAALGGLPEPEEEKQDKTK